MSSQVMVYLFTSWDDRARSIVTSDVYATIMTIRSGLGMPVLESGKSVPRAEVEGGIHRSASSRSLAPSRWW
jgi:hypothetical protein